MPWVIGIDEAGYGPNLGPLVQAAAMAKLPAFDLAGWESLNHKIRRAHEPKDGRVLVDDSKKCYRNGNGLDEMSKSLSEWHGNDFAHLIFNRDQGKASIGIQAEYWFEEKNYDLDVTYAMGPLLNAGLYPMGFHAATPQRLNAIIDQHGSKAPAILQGYIQLVRGCFQVLDFMNECREVQEVQNLVIIADKFGGRHYYSALLQATFPDGWVVTERESPEESRYRIDNLPHTVTAIFKPKADGDSISVALASMMAKYVREECMSRFNAFWAKHVPGIKPTAGYPVDAKRFFAEIEPAMKKLGIPKDAVWRKK